MIGRTRDPLWDFIERYVTSFARWDLLAYFAARPEPPQTPRQLARRLARREPEIRQACEGLAHEGVLRATNGIIGSSYSLGPDPALRTAVDTFAASTRARDMRLRVLTHLLKSGSR